MFINILLIIKSTPKPNFKLKNIFSVINNNKLSIIICWCHITERVLTHILLIYTLLNLVSGQLSDHIKFIYYLFR